MQFQTWTGVKHCAPKAQTWTGAKHCAPNVNTLYFISLMHNITILRNLFCGKPLRWSVSLVLSCSLTISLGTVVQAESPEKAPQELKTILSEIESAANRQNVEEVMKFYSPEFKNSDGLTQTSLAKALTQIWKQYDNLTYKTTLESWEQVGDELMAETVTNIEGTTQDKSRPMRLEGKIKSRQYFKNQKLVRQEILAEETRLTSGNKPPTIEDVDLPDEVKVGQEFEFDVIVKEPLNNDLLLGTAIQEKIDGDHYLKPSTLNLELLSAGGIFKRAKAPNNPENHWLSAVLVRGDGMIIFTRRVTVEK